MSVSATLGGEALADQAEITLHAERFDEAIALFDLAEPDVRDPDRCAGGRWMAHMLRGEFAPAWRESDAIRRRGAPDPHRFWSGEELAGRRLMLRSLHGFGDAVQMFRFLPRLRAQVGELIVEVPPRLMEMAPCFAGMGQVITWGEAAPAEPPAWDVQAEVMELPYLLRVTTDDLAPTRGYLQLPQTVRDRTSACMGGRQRPRAGLVWGAGEWNPSRSVPFQDFSALLAVAEIEFWSLQGGTDRDAWTAMRAGPMRRDVSSCGDGILPLAAAVAQMDLVITVDTLAAHLAGALGVPCWVLLQHRADWRWMSRRADSPWYPSLRLWRQAAPGNWQGLIEDVREELWTWRQTQR